MWESQQNPSTAEVISHETTLACVDALGRVTAIDAGFGYDPTDPYTVSITFRAADGDVRWDFARDLVLDGILEPTGDGDVHVWPCTDIDGVPVVMMEFSSPDGELLTQAPARDVHRFAARSLAMVGRGEESAHLDVEGAILQLLG